MAENKTKPTDASVEDYIASRANAQQRNDCRELMVLFKKVSRQKRSSTAAATGARGCPPVPSRRDQRDRNHPEPCCCLPPRVSVRQGKASEDEEFLVERGHPHQRRGVLRP